jgi:[pyruvate, water dikinase]-phosphate phosphotransferase / [pyruvate, water dikinase] kinase
MLNDVARPRAAFFLSDRTGITVEMLGHSLLRQFEDVPFDEITLPYLDTREKAVAAVEQINDRAGSGALRPLVFSTIVSPEIRRVIDSAIALHLDCFGLFVALIEAELGVLASPSVGLSHRVDDTIDHYQRIEAIRYTLEHDDGMSRKDWELADIVLVGVSRVGKTPTCLYLALQYGINAANYPLIPEDLNRVTLPEQIGDIRHKLVGFTVEPARLHQMRSERKPGSEYASLRNCQHEVRAAEALMYRMGIPYLDASNKSIEELATAVLHQAKLERRIY